MPVSPDDIRASLKAHPDVYAIYLTSPNYEGLTANYEEIRDICADKVLIVDEAHGAHFYFNS